MNKITEEEVTDIRSTTVSNVDKTRIVLSLLSITPFIDNQPIYLPNSYLLTHGVGHRMF